MQPFLRVDDHQHQIGLVDRGGNLTANRGVDRGPLVVGDATGVDEKERPSLPFGARKMPVACRPGFIAHDGSIVADDPVEQHGLSHVRPADERHDWCAGHAAPTISAASGSPASTSTKSYDARTGIGSAPRSDSNVSSSRNKPSSLIDSAGMSTRSKSTRPASTRRMSAPTSSPAVVTPEPNSEFSARMTSI